MKIQGQNKQMLAAACQMFMGKSEAEIAQIALETLEGHQRAIIAHLTVEVRIRWLFVSVFHLMENVHAKGLFVSRCFPGCKGTQRTLRYIRRWAEQVKLN